MKINGIQGITTRELNDELANGAKFVMYQYCISIVVLTFKRSTDVYFVRAGESAVGKGIGWTFLTLFLGWWGIPWGPIYTIGSLVTNFGGGKDVTNEIVAAINGHSASDTAAVAVA
jgi:hypothetical protein